ncbi:hypothetical protein BGZ91_001658, partial [Linnemannia elongata]
DKALGSRTTIGTGLNKDQIQSLPRGDFVRLRFHRQIELVSPDEYMYMVIQITMEDGCEEDEVGFQLNYVELGSGNFRSNTDYVIFGGSPPHQFVSVGSSKENPDQAIRIHAFVVSDTGHHAATFHYADGMGHVNVWDISQPLIDAEMPRPRHIDTPYAHTAFPAKARPADFHFGFANFASITISSNASQVTLSSVKESPDAIPFTIYQIALAAPADKDFSATSLLKKKTSICPNLVGFLGYGYFHRPNNTGSSESENNGATLTGTNDDIYLAFSGSGSVMGVYNTSGAWSLLHILDFGMEINAWHLICFEKSLRGRYIVWNGSPGVMTIVDILTGGVVSHIYLPDDSSPSLAIFNHDVSKVAITVKGVVQIHDTHSGIRLGTYKDNLPGYNNIDLAFEKDHFLVVNSTMSNFKKPDYRTLVRTNDMEAVGHIQLNQDYSLSYPQIPNIPLFIESRGSVLNVVRLPILYPSPEIACDKGDTCESKRLSIFLLWNGFENTLQATDKSCFYLEAGYNNRDMTSFLRIGVGSDAATVTNTMELPFGRVECTATFIPEKSQLLILLFGTLFAWNLSATNRRVCELAYIMCLEEDLPEYAALAENRSMTGGTTCQHGESIELELGPRLWVRRGTVPEVVERRDNEPPGMATIPVPPTDTIDDKDTIGTDLKYRYDNAIHELVAMYGRGNEVCRKHIIQYLQTFIQPTEEYRTPCLTLLCRAWTQENRTHLESILNQLLPADRITWAPPLITIQGEDPLSILLETAKTRPFAIGAAKVIMDYCVAHANRSKNQAFLGPLFGCMDELMKQFPREALKRMGRIAHIPVRHRDFIIENHELALPIWHYWRFWSGKKETLATTKDPVMQFKLSSPAGDSSNDGFTQEVFMAHFDSLWHYMDEERVRQETQSTLKTTWWKTLLHMLLMKCHLRMPAVVECYDFNLENTIGFTYWAVRFIPQCIFYALVVTVALIQVYDQTATVQIGLFIAILVVAMSSYNVLDVVAFAWPLGASIHQLVLIYTNNDQGTTRPLSFAVLVVFLHMLFELRINKSVCKYVTIIQQAVVEIRAFFIIFAGGLLAFAIATLHLLRACPVEGCMREETDFPHNFFGALSATYFFMGGRYDPVSPFFDTEDWWFHIMMIVFFFFTVIVMLNVLIALINVAFTKGDDGWRLAWIESRLWYIESAENMSYLIPGFRKTHNVFPKQIYFTATKEEVKEYRRKYFPKQKKVVDKALAKKMGWGLNDEEEDVGGEDEFLNTPLFTLEEEQDQEQEQTASGESASANASSESLPESVSDDGGDEKGAEVNSSGVEELVTSGESSILQELKTQVTDLQKQLTGQNQQIALQQQHAERLFQELKELLLLRASSSSTSS